MPAWLSSWARPRGAARFGAPLPAALLLLLTSLAARAAPVEVSDAVALQAALDANAPLILLKDHINISSLHAGTPNAGSLVISSSTASIAIWGSCDASTLPDAVITYHGAHAVTLQPGNDACSIFTTGRTDVPNPTNGTTAATEVSAIKMPNGGRLYLTNIIVNTVDVGTTGPFPPKASYGLDVWAGGQLWMVNSVAAFFQQSNIRAVDAHVFMINSFTYQAESSAALTSGQYNPYQEGGIVFLSERDISSVSPIPLTLFSYGTTLHFDVAHDNNPIYVGALVQTPQASSVFGTGVDFLKSSPLIYLDRTYEHIHFGAQPGCIGLCLCTPGFTQPRMYVNTTSDFTIANFTAITPGPVAACNAPASPPFQPVTAITWSQIMPPGTVTWADSLIAAGVPAATLLLSPNGTAAAPPSSSSSSISGGAIAGIIIAVIAAVLLVALLLFCLYRRSKRAAAAPDAPPAKVHDDDDVYATGPEFLQGRPPTGRYPGDVVGSMPSPYPPGTSFHGVGASPGLGYPLHPHPPGAASIARVTSPAAQENSTLSGFTNNYTTQMSVGSQNATTLSAHSAASRQNQSLDSLEMLTQKRQLLGGQAAVDFGVLDSMLDEVERHWGGELLERYVSLGPSKRSYGGQGMVQFARLKFNAEKEVAIKFFMSRTGFNTEQALYVNPTLHRILPPIDDVGANENARFVDPFGRAFPPFVVMEKGQPLDVYAKRKQPDFPSCLQIIQHLVRRIAELHSLGFCHRDLKPSNTIWLPSRNEWTVIDYGSCARTGEPAPLSISLGYAAPELIRARDEGVFTVVADEAHDVWALGVVAIELLTSSPTFVRREDATLDELVVGTMLKGDLLPWEAPETASQVRRKLGFMQDMLLRMVSRDAAQRPALREVEASWRKLLQEVTSTMI